MWVPPSNKMIDHPARSKQTEKNFPKAGESVTPLRSPAAGIPSGKGGRDDRERDR